MNDFPTPPPRRLPPEVRERVRDQVLTNLEDATRSRFPRSRGPLAVAAGVAILAAGAMIVTQSVDDTSSTGGVPFPSTRPTTSTSGPPAPNADAELDRCFGAVRSAGKINEFPDRRLWRPVASRRYQMVNLTAAMIEGRPMFCQTTETSVTITDPSASPAFAGGTRTGAVLMSDEGIVAGVLDPSWPGLNVEINSKAAGTTMGGPADILPNRLFVTVSSLRPDGDTKVTVSGGGVAAATLPRPAAPAIEYLRDQPTNPPPDRTSDRARWLVDCLAGSQFAVVDPDSWDPAAMVTVQGSRMMLLRFGNRVASCGFENIAPVAPNRYQFHPLEVEWPGEVTRPRFLETGVLNLPGHDVRWLTYGALPNAATSMKVICTDDTTFDADVFKSTFIAALPADKRIATIRVFDGAGAVLYDGPLS